MKPKKILACSVLILFIIGVPFYDAFVCLGFSFWWSLVAIPIALLASTCGAFIGIWIGKTLMP